MAVGPAAPLEMFEVAGPVQKRANGKERGRGGADINEVIGTEARSARKEHGVYCECTKSYVL